MYYILLAFTSYNLYVWLKYMCKLEKDLYNSIYIYGDYMHSLQHIAMTWFSLTLSIAMLFGVVTDYTLLIYLMYNAFITFIVLPHLISEE